MTSFEEIEQGRANAGITRKALYQAAGVNKETWRRTVQGTTLPNTRTLNKLKAALDRLVQQKDQSNG
ncbi:MAG: helix-turn-helix transcriptional regulator [Mesorhizobium sp.]|nr:MAG: helix-turn-helix transcriptional regulator [Mesorhizobium sp.]